MSYLATGLLLSSVGGRFCVRLFATPKGPLSGKTIVAKGRGALHRELDLLAGDHVIVSYDDSSFCEQDGEILPDPNASGIVIEKILERKSALIRPPVANLDFLFAALAVASPEPDLTTFDKLLAIAEYHEIEPVVLLTKCDLDGKRARELAALYRKAGFIVFCLGEGEDFDFAALREFIKLQLAGKLACLAGASGIGKSTLLNKLFPELHLETGDLSQKIARGKNTTRRVELYPISEDSDCGYLADTPGFTLLDFERFDFFSKDDLPYTFREFAPYLAKWSCRYTKCSHTKEEGCAIVDAVKRGEISKSRHASFCALYEVLKKKKEW